MQFSVGLFDPAQNDPYTTIEVPRLEAELVWTKNDTKLWVGALAQTDKSATDESASSYGISGGARLGFKRISLTASGFAGKGLGTTLTFLDGATGGTGRLRRPARFVRRIGPAHLHADG